MRPSLTFRTAIFLMFAMPMASVRAGQSPTLPASAGRAPAPAAQFPGIPNGHQFPLAPETRQFSPIPEVKQFPPPKTLSLKLSTPIRVETTRVDESRVVCGMVVVPGHADHDRKILRPVSPDAPKGVIESVEGTCEGPLVDIAPPSPPAR
jgi:hypothetical protein